MNEAETTAGMGRRWWPQLRAGERVRAHMRAPARTRAREAEPTKYAVASKPDRP